MEARSRRLGLQHGNSVGRAVFLSKGQACRGVLPNEELHDQKCGDWDADVVEVGRTVLTDTVKRRDCYFELYSLWHWELIKHVAKGRRDVFVSPNTDDQTGGSVQDHLKSTDDLGRSSVHNAVAVINSTGDECSMSPTHSQKNQTRP